MDACCFFTGNLMVLIPAATFHCKRLLFFIFLMSKKNTVSVCDGAV